MKKIFPASGILFAALLISVNAQVEMDTALVPDSQVVIPDIPDNADIIAVDSVGLDTVAVSDSQVIDTSSSAMLSDSVPSVKQVGSDTTPESYYGGGVRSSSRGQRGVSSVDLFSPPARKKMDIIPVDSIKTTATKDSLEQMNASPVSVSVSDSIKPAPKNPYKKKTVKVSNLKKSDKILLYVSTSVVTGGVVAAILANAFKKGEADQGIPDPPLPPGH